MVRYEYRKEQGIGSCKVKKMVIRQVVSDNKLRELLRDTQERLIKANQKINFLSKELVEERELSESFYNKLCEYSDKNKDLSIRLEAVNKMSDLGYNPYQE